MPTLLQKMLYLQGVRNWAWTWVRLVLSPLRNFSLLPRHKVFFKICCKSLIYNVITNNFWLLPLLLIKKPTYKKYNVKVFFKVSFPNLTVDCAVELYNKLSFPGTDAETSFLVLRLLQLQLLLFVNKQNVFLNYILLLMCMVTEVNTWH